MRKVDQYLNIDVRGKILGEYFEETEKHLYEKGITERTLIDKPHRIRNDETRFYDFCKILKHVDEVLNDRNTFSIELKNEEKNYIFSKSFKESDSKYLVPNDPEYYNNSLCESVTDSFRDLLFKDMDNRFKVIHAESKNGTSIKFLENFLECLNLTFLEHLHDLNLKNE